MQTIKMEIVEPANTLLTKFINEKASSYQEPERRGTPKGEPIGFSRAKFFISLLMMTKMKLKEISVKTKISYGLIRNWNSEKEFRDLVESHHLEFAEVFINKIKEWKDRLDDRHRELLKRPMKEIASLEPLSPDYSEFMEVKYYSNHLVRYILESLLIELKRDKDSSLKVTFYFMIHFLVTQTAGRSAWGEAGERLIHMSDLGILGFIKDALLNPSSTNRKKAIFALSQIERTLKERRELQSEESGK